MTERSPAPPSFWDQAAERWDSFLADGLSFVNHEEAFRRFHWFLKRVVKIGNRTKSFRLLDLACGTGEAAWPLWKRVASVTFLDRSAAMLRLARNKWPKGVFVRGEAERLPFLDSEFDVVVSRGALLSQLDPDDLPDFFRHLRRVTRPGALILLDFVANRDRWNAPPHLFPGAWTKPQMLALLSEHFPTAQVLAYDGTDIHGLNRICLKRD